MPLVSVSEFTDTHFDYVIVGGGTSGLTVATRLRIHVISALKLNILYRLAENPNLVVGVIEAGGHHIDVPEIYIPGMHIHLES